MVETLIGAEAAARFWDTFRDVYVAEEDIRFIKAAGFNTVRVPLHWNLFVAPGDGGADRFEGPGWRLLDRRDRHGRREAGLRVIVDLHAAPGGQTGVNHDDGVGFPLTFYVPRHRQLTVALWRTIAARYRDDPTVLGYDLLNEPISPYSDEGYLNPRLEPFYREIVTAIRSVDTNHVVLLAGGQWSSNFAMFGRPFDANVVYTYHQFWADPTRKSIQRYLNFSNRWNVPLLIGETGESTDRLERPVSPATRALRHRLELLGLQKSRFRRDRGLDREARRMGAHCRADRCGHSRGRKERHAARAGAGDPRRVPGGRAVPQRPHQRRLSQVARAGGAVAASVAECRRRREGPVNHRPTPRIPAMRRDALTLL